ncbi:hypothetical protein [Streptomyces sp. C10-9-1]|uniref:hypothetical protein n=1 Tax=Streptomyces sp. C10-9-1 TaxID=1859285 RepID=UPI0027E3D100|nr:hypothetical protein [Streptomyces sp. C10-9-1]
MLLAAGAAGAAALTGCSSGAPPGGRTVAAVDPVRAERALRSRLAARSTALLGEYDAVLGSHPGLAGRLGPLRAAVAAHAAALAGESAPQRPSGPGEGSASPSGAPARPAAPSGSAPAVAAGPVPEDPGAALKALAAAERRASDEHLAAVTEAGPELARLLASVAAADAAHAYLLTKGEER